MSNASIQFLSAIHGNDGAESVGAYQSGNAVTDKFNAAHGFRQLNTLFCVDLSFTITAVAGESVTLYAAYNDSMTNRFSVGDKINLHWNQSLLAESRCDGLTAQSVNGRTIVVTGGAGDPIPAIGTVVTLSNGTGRAFDRMDFVAMAGALKKTDWYPPGSMIMINREGWPWYQLTGMVADNRPRVDLLNSFIDLIKWCKQARPDCSFGLFEVVACNYWDYHAMRSQRDLSGSYRYDLVANHNAYVKPLADAVDFLVPAFYPPASDPNASFSTASSPLVAQPYEDAICDWLEHSIMVCQRDFPGKPILPLLWYQNYGEYQEINKKNPGCLSNPSFTWTVELLDKMFVPGSLWRKMLDLIFTDTTVANYTDPTKPNYKKALGMCATWGEGSYIPFANAPWWIETQQFLKDKIMSIAEIQEVLDSLVAATSAKENAVAAVVAADKTIAEKKAALLAAIEIKWPG